MDKQNVAMMDEELDMVAGGRHKPYWLPTNKPRPWDLVPFPRK